MIMAYGKNFFTRKRVEEMEAYVRSEKLPGMFYVYVYRGDRKRAHFFGPKGKGKGKGKAEIVTCKNKSKSMRKAIWKAFKIENENERSRMIVIVIQPSSHID